MLAIVAISGGVAVVLNVKAQVPTNPPTLSTITIDGKPIQATTLNLISGPYVTWLCQPVGADQLNCQNQVNTAVLQTRKMSVQGIDHFCKSTSQTPSFTCKTETPATWCGATGYVAGTWIDLAADADTSGPAWVNVNGCGLASVKLADGTTDPGTAIKNGSYYHLVQDATVWRME